MPHQRALFGKPAVADDANELLLARVYSQMHRQIAVLGKPAIAKVADEIPFARVHVFHVPLQRALFAKRSVADDANEVLFAAVCFCMFNQIATVGKSAVTYIANELPFASVRTKMSDQSVPFDKLPIAHMTCKIVFSFVYS